MPETFYPLKEEKFKLIILEKLVEKMVSKERKLEILSEIAKELGLDDEEVEALLYEDEVEPKAIDLDYAISVLAKAYEKKTSN